MQANKIQTLFFKYTTRVLALQTPSEHLSFQNHFRLGVRMMLKFIGKIQYAPQPI